MSNRGKDHYFHRIRQRVNKAEKIAEMARHLASALDYVDYCRESLNKAIEEADMENDPLMPDPRKANEPSEVDLANPMRKGGKIEG